MTHSQDGDANREHSIFFKRIDMRLDTSNVFDQKTLCGTLGSDETLVLFGLGTECTSTDSWAAQGKAISRPLAT